MHLLQQLFKKRRPSFYTTVKSIVKKAPFDEAGLLESVETYFPLGQTTNEQVLAVCRREGIQYVIDETHKIPFRVDFYTKVNAKVNETFDHHLVCLISVFNFRILTTTENYIGFYFRDKALVEITVAQNGLEI